MSFLPHSSSFIVPLLFGLLLLFFLPSFNPCVLASLFVPPLLLSCFSPLHISLDPTILPCCALPSLVVILLFLPSSPFLVVLSSINRSFLVEICALKSSWTLYYKLNTKKVTCEMLWWNVTVTCMWVPGNICWMETAQQDSTVNEWLGGRMLQVQGQRRRRRLLPWTSHLTLTLNEREHAKLLYRCGMKSDGVVRS